MTGSVATRFRHGLLLWGMVVLLAILCLAAFCLGRYPLDVSDVLRILASRVLPLEPDWDPLAENVVLVLRMPRIAASLLVGGALALSGACYQGVFKNPLVSPDLLGVSAGAGVGAALAILLGLGTLGTQAFAFVLGMTTVLLATSIPKILRNASVTMLVLSGIIMSGVMNSLMGVMKYLADPETQLASITYWQMGSLAKVTDKDVLAIFPWIFLCSLALVAVRWRINLLSLGDNEARALGVNVRLVRGIVIFCATLLTACSVSVSGTIGWVGLVIPHLARTIAGPDNVRAVPASLVLGAGFMLFVDTAARVLIEAEIPLSILTGLIGAPFFFFVLAKQRMKLS